VFFMEIKSVIFCEMEENCSQRVFEEVCKNCGIKTDEKMMDMLNGINAGFGIKGICSAIVGGICALGCVCSEEEMKTIRLLLFEDFSERFSSLNCGFAETEEGCAEIIEFVQRWAEEKIRAKK
ncbi:MAG: C-GCAxxG-C-C family protein, partial [Firmicutes bacterium]|nr:C-GCAxxG-C-C family protein [Bacillota bacterium]